MHSLGAKNVNRLYLPPRKKINGK